MEDIFFNDDCFIPKFETITRPSLTFQSTDSFELINNNKFRSKSVASIASVSEKILGLLPLGANRKNGKTKKIKEKFFTKDSDVFWLLNDTQPK